MNNKKILTIDGGGIKGVFPASFLASIEEKIDGSIYEYFDLIVGTSTGGIIALALGLGIPAKDILGFYEKHGPEIFKGNRFFKFIQHFVFTKYENKGLKSALEKTFGENKLGQSKTRLVIPSFNLETGEVYVYKTAHHPRFQRDYTESIVHIALATSAAPTFFPVHYIWLGNENNFLIRDHHPEIKGKLGDLARFIYTENIIAGITAESREKLSIKVIDNIKAYLKDN